MNSIDRAAQAIQNAKVQIEECNFSLAKSRDLLNRGKLLLLDLQIIEENRNVVLESLKSQLSIN